MEPNINFPAVMSSTVLGFSGMLQTTDKRYDHLVWSFVRAYYQLWGFCPFLNNFLVIEHTFNRVHSRRPREPRKRSYPTSVLLTIFMRTGRVLNKNDTYKKVAYCSGSFINTESIYSPIHSHRWVHQLILVLSSLSGSVLKYTNATFYFLPVHWMFFPLGLSFHIIGTIFCCYASRLHLIK